MATISQQESGKQSPWAGNDDASKTSGVSVEHEGRQSGKNLPCDKITTWPNSKVITNNWGTNNRHNSGEREVYMATNSQQDSGKKLPCARNHDASVEQEVQIFSHWQTKLPPNNTGEINMRHHSGERDIDYISNERDVELPPNNTGERNMKRHSGERDIDSI